MSNRFNIDGTDCVQPLLCPLASLFNIVLFCIIIYKQVKLRGFNMATYGSLKFWVIVSFIVQCLFDFVKNGLAFEDDPMIESTFNGVMIILTRQLLYFCTFFSIFYLFKKATKGRKYFTLRKKLNRAILLVSQLINLALTIIWLNRLFERLNSKPDSKDVCYEDESELQTLCKHQYMCTLNIFMVDSLIELAYVMLFAAYIFFLIRNIRAEIK